MNGEPVCCCTSQLCATASIQLPTLLTSAPIQIQRKARWRKTANMKRGLIAERARRIAIHPADAAFVRERSVVVDDELRPGERVGPFTVVDAQGKSPGEIALHWPERRMLLVGDACVGNPPGECALLPDKVIDDKRMLIESLRKLAKLEFDSLLVGDGAPLLQGGRPALERLVAKVS